MKYTTAIHLHHTEPQESLLINGVFSFVNALLKNGAIAEYFFIRYHENGPHIRLRISGNRELIEKVVLPKCLEYFKTFLNLHPSADILDTENIPANWHPNNSVRQQTYQPETARFGGDKVIHLIEQQFFLSSQISLAHISQKADQWSYDDALATAIKLHLGFVKSLDFSVAQSIQFFQVVYHNWLPHAFSNRKAEMTEANYQKNVEKITEQFEKAFALQESALLTYHQQIWDYLQQPDLILPVPANPPVIVIDESSEPFEIWLQYNRHLKKALDDIPPNQIIAATDTDTDTRWSIYADLIHLTNNRLGIRNHDEAFLAYLLARTLDKMI